MNAEKTLKFGRKVLASMLPLGGKYGIAYEDLELLKSCHSARTQFRVVPG
jgi:hypothetical protein